MTSILTSIKKMLGITEEDTSFDPDLIMHINSVLMILNQLGVGPSSGFVIKDANDEWDDFLPEEILIEAVKSYVYLKVRLIFDPPLSSAVADAINKNISELEFRINIMVDTDGNTSEDIENIENRITSLENRVNDHDKLFGILVGDNNE